MSMRRQLIDSELVHPLPIGLTRDELEAAEFVGAFALRDEGQPGVQHLPCAPEERPWVGCLIADIVAPDGMRGQDSVFLGLRDGVGDELLKGCDVDILAVDIRGGPDARAGRLGVVECFQIIIDVVQDAGIIGIDQGGRTSVSPLLYDVIAGVPELRDLISLFLHLLSLRFRSRGCGLGIRGGGIGGCSCIGFNRIGRRVRLCRGRGVTCCDGAGDGVYRC